MIQEGMLERYTKLDGGNEIDTTAVPMLISHFYKNRSLEGKHIFANSLPITKLILGKRFAQHPYYRNRLSGFHNDRRGTFSTKGHYGGFFWNLVDILITCMKIKDSKISKQRTSIPNVSKYVKYKSWPFVFG